MIRFDELVGLCLANSSDLNTLAAVSKKTEAKYVHDNCIYGLPSFLAEYKEEVCQFIYYTSKHATT